MAQERQEKLIDYGEILDRGPSNGPKFAPFFTSSKATEIPSQTDAFRHKGKVFKV